MTREPFATVDDARIMEFTEAIRDAVCNEWRQNDDELNYVFSALMTTFEHFAATLQQKERQGIFQELRENLHLAEQRAEQLALQGESLVGFSPTVVGRA
jgi:hypothetical protein